MMIHVRIWGLWFVVTAVLSCGESAGPTPPPPPPPSPPPGPPNPRVVAGDTISGSLSGSERVTYSFVGQNGAEYAVFFEANSGGGTLVVKDSVTGAPVATVSDLAGGPDISTQVSDNFSRAGILLLEVIGAVQGSTRFRFFIYPVNRAPESRSPRFNVGDTVSGESIDAIPDVDDFFTAGRAGEYLAGWIEPLGPTAGPALWMQVADPVSSTAMAYTYSIVGQSPHSLFVAGPLPGDRDYRLTIPGPPPALSNSRYTGPYRFHVYEIDPKPETAAGAIAVNTVVTEQIDIPGDIDDFTFQAPVGAEFNAFIQSSAARFVSLSPLGPIEGGALFTNSVAADTGLFRHGSGRFKALKDTTYRLRIRSQQASDAAGSYRLYLYRVNRAPESVPAVVTIGDTITGESIDPPGDVDEFTLSGTAGQQVNIFVEAESSATGGIQFSLLNPAGQVMSSISMRGPGGDLLSQSTGRFAFPATGTYKLRFDGPVGPYRFFVYPVNPQPETHRASIGFRDSVETESIDVPGDIDEFTFSVTDSSGAILFYETEANLGVGVSVLRAVSRQPVTIDSYYRSFTLRPGSYILRVQSPPYPDAGAGWYKVWMYPSKPTPESRSENIAIGDTIDGELIDPPGDVDVFYFNGVKGQHVNFALQGTSDSSSNAGYTAMLYQPNNLMGWVSTPTSSPTLGSQQTTRLDLPATGRYTIRVSGGSSPTQRIEHGPYRFALTAVDTMPEHVGTALVPGDSVTDELIDTRGDWDQFTLTGTPGEELGFVFQSSGTNSFPFIVAFNPATGDMLARTVGQFTRFAGPFRVPSGGQTKVAVYEPALRFYECYDATCGNVFTFTGSYRFSIIHVNRAPERASATYVIADTARDSISVGDIDEYTASATPGSALTAYLRLTAPPVNGGNGYGLTLEIINPVTGDTLAGKGTEIFGQTQLYPVGTFTVPAGGQFLIRVRGSGTFGDDIITAPYEMQVKP